MQKNATTYRRLFGLTPIKRYPSTQYIPTLDLRTRERKEYQAKQARLNEYARIRASVWHLALGGVFVACIAGITSSSPRDNGNG